MFEGSVMFTFTHVTIIGLYSTSIDKVNILFTKCQNPWKSKCKFQ